MCVCNKQMIRKPFWGLTQQKGPWRTTPLDVQRARETEPNWQGGSVGKGGTQHAGHDRWQSSINPKAAPPVGPIQPPTYMPSIIGTRQRRPNVKGVGRSTMRHVKRTGRGLKRTNGTYTDETGGKTGPIVQDYPGVADYPESEYGGSEATTMYNESLHAFKEGNVALNEGSGFGREIEQEYLEEEGVVKSRMSEEPRKAMVGSRAMGTTLGRPAIAARAHIPEKENSEITREREIQRELYQSDQERFLISNQLENARQKMDDELRQREAEQEIYDDWDGDLLQQAMKITGIEHVMQRHNDEVERGQRAAELELKKEKIQRAQKMAEMAHAHNLKLREIQRQREVAQELATKAFEEMKEKHDRDIALMEQRRQLGVEEKRRVRFAGASQDELFEIEHQLDVLRRRHPGAEVERPVIGGPILIRRKKNVRGKK